MANASGQVSPTDMNAEVLLTGITASLLTANRKPPTTEAGLEDAKKYVAECAQQLAQRISVGDVPDKPSAHLQGLISATNYLKQQHNMAPGEALNESVTTYLAARSSGFTATVKGMLNLMPHEVSQFENHPAGFHVRLAATLGQSHTQTLQNLAASTGHIGGMGGL